MLHLGRRSRARRSSGRNFISLMTTFVALRLRFLAPLVLLVLVLAVVHDLADRRIGVGVRPRRGRGPAPGRSAAPRAAACTPSCDPSAPIRRTWRARMRSLILASSVAMWITWSLVCRIRGRRSRLLTRRWRMQEASATNRMPGHPLTSSGLKEGGVNGRSLTDPDSVHAPAGWVGGLPSQANPTGRVLNHFPQIFEGRGYQREWALDTVGRARPPSRKPAVEAVDNDYLTRRGARPGSRRRAAAGPGRDRRGPGRGLVATPRGRALELAVLHLSPDEDRPAASTRPPIAIDAMGGHRRHPGRPPRRPRLQRSRCPRPAPASRSSRCRTDAPRAASSVARAPGPSSGSSCAVRLLIARSGSGSSSWSGLRRDRRRLQPGEVVLAPARRSTVEPKTDGSMHVVEHITYDFPGPFSYGTRPIPVGPYTISDMRVTEHGQELLTSARRTTSSGSSPPRTSSARSTSVHGASAAVGRPRRRRALLEVGRRGPPEDRPGHRTLTVPPGAGDVKAWGHGELPASVTRRRRRRARGTRPTSLQGRSSRAGSRSPRRGSPWPPVARPVCRRSSPRNAAWARAANEARAARPRSDAKKAKDARTSPTS